MATRVQPFTVTCPAATKQANAIEIATAFAAGVVGLIEVRFPSGHAFTTGLAIAIAHQVVIPDTGNDWLIGDGETHKYETEGYPESGAWSVFLFNTDLVNAHSWQIRYHITEVTRKRPPMRIYPITPEEIYASAEGR